MKNQRLTLADLEQWADNDEGIYNAWRASGLGRRAYVREHAEELRAAIGACLNRPPAGYHFDERGGTRRNMF
jgi:hypothetical protein